MTTYEEYTDMSPDIFDDSGKRITEAQITGVPYLIYMGTSVLYPMMTIDSGDSYVDAEWDRSIENAFQLAFEIISENPKVYLGSETDDSEIDWEEWAEEQQDINANIKLMFPPHVVGWQKDSATYMLEEIGSEYDAFLGGLPLDEGLIHTCEVEASGWREVPEGGLPLNASDIADAYDALASAIGTGERSYINPAFDSLLKELGKVG